MTNLSLVISSVTLLMLVVDVMSQSSCLTSPAPNGYKQWTNNVINWSVTAVWAPERACTTMNGCFKSDGLNLTVDIPISVYQLPPVAMQPGMILSFQVSTYLGVAPNMTYIKVDSTGFADCDGSTGAIVPSTISNNGVQIIPSSFLKTGSNYFIANSSSSPLYACHFGMRINVTVQQWNCSVGMSSADQPCTDQGLCIALPWEAFFQCDCCPGFIGSYCQVNDQCSTQPCINGGTCTNTQPGMNLTPLFTCTCPPGYTGDTCEIQSDVCTVNQCQNSGQCFMTDPTNFVCKCPPSYTGSLCETKTTACGSNPCLNGGTCIDSTTAYLCLCLTGYSGINCNIGSNTGTCTSVSCFNGGTCVARSGVTTCICPTGYTGIDCSVKISLCIPTPCVYAIECIDYGTTFSCTCQPGFTGELCNVNINECASNPCVNNGTCYDLVAEFLCVCDAVYVGTRCENLISDASSSGDTGGDTVDKTSMTSSDSQLIRDLGIAAGVLFAILLIVILILLAYHFKLHVKMRNYCCRQRQYVKHIEVPSSPRRI